MLRDLELGLAVSDRRGSGCAFLAARAQREGLRWAASVVTPSSEVPGAEVARERLCSQRGATAARGRNGTGQDGFCLSFKHALLSKYLSRPKLCLLVLVCLNLILL